MEKIFQFILIFLIMSCGNSKGQKSSKERIVDHLEIDAYLKLINDHRQNLQLTQLKPLVQIEHVAREHSEKMAQKHRPFGHWGWRERCSRIKKELGEGNLCAEIVARGQNNVENVFRAWMNSPGHRKAIEGKDFTHTGIAFSQSSNGEFYWTQIFLEIDP